MSACHDGFRALVEGDLSELSASVLGTGVADFKDKVNYKQPGGAGFSPHQDLPLLSDRNTPAAVATVTSSASRGEIARSRAAPPRMDWAPKAVRLSQLAPSFWDW